MKPDYFWQLRERTASYICGAGLTYSEMRLPPILGEEALHVKRSSVEVGNRILVQFAIACLAVEPAKNLDTNRVKIIHWLESNSLIHAVNQWERQILLTTGRLSRMNKTLILDSIESMVALAWSTRCVDNLDPFVAVTDDFGSIFPSIDDNESSEDFITRSFLRNVSDLHNMLDLYYVLDWMRVNSLITGISNRKAPEAYLVRRRRHSLEWLFSEKDWADVSLDT